MQKFAGKFLVMTVLLLSAAAAAVGIAAFCLSRGLFRATAEDERA